MRRDPRCCGVGPGLLPPGSRPAGPGRWPPESTPQGSPGRERTSSIMPPPPPPPRLQWRPDGSPLQSPDRSPRDSPQRAAQRPIRPSPAAPRQLPLPPESTSQSPLPRHDPQRLPQREPCAHRAPGVPPWSPDAGGYGREPPLERVAGSMAERPVLETALECSTGSPRLVREREQTAEVASTPRTSAAVQPSGSSSASDYKALEGDEIDQALQYHARQLPRYLGECLKIMRVCEGEYIIGTDYIRMGWNKHPSSNGTFSKGVCVTRFGRAPHDDAPSEALPEYLRLSANVAFDLQRSMTNVPLASRLTFEEAGTALLQGDAAAKLDAMMMATRQARIRQEAAEEWRKHNQHSSMQSCDTSPLSGSRHFEDIDIVEVERDTEVLATVAMPVPPDGLVQPRAEPRLLSGDVSRLCRPGPLKPAVLGSPARRMQSSGLPNAGLDSPRPSRLLSSPPLSARPMPDPFGAVRS